MNKLIAFHWNKQGFVLLVPMFVLILLLQSGCSFSYTTRLALSGDGDYLAWRPNTEADLLGYNVYRNGQLFASLPQDVVDLPLNYNTDAGLFQVSALDKAGNESELSNSVSYAQQASSQPSRPILYFVPVDKDTLTVSAGDTIRIVLQQRAIYENGTRFNTELVDSIGIHLKNITTGSQWYTLFHYNPKAVLLKTFTFPFSTGMYAICATSFSSGVESFCAEQKVFTISAYVDKYFSIHFLIP